MTAERTIEDRLREEYFELLPEVRRVAATLEADIRHALLAVSQSLEHEYERVTVTLRIKECESAVDALRRRAEGATFDRSRPKAYTLTTLNDLAGARVLFFPQRLQSRIDRALRRRFPSWSADPIRGPGRAELARKYHGSFPRVSTRVRGEYQIVPMLVGLFWEVEHSTFYKPSPRFKGLSKLMYEPAQDVLRALRAYEEEFARQIRASTRRVRPRRF